MFGRDFEHSIHHDGFHNGSQSTSSPKSDKFAELQNEVKELKDYIEEVFADYNDINDDTRMQLELINQTLAELQTKKKLEEKPRRKIGFIQHDE